MIAGVEHIITTFRIGNLNGMAQQAAYNVLFGIAPLLITIMALVSLIMQEFAGYQEHPAQPVVRWITEHLPPETAAFLQQPFESALAINPTSLLSVGGVLALWASRGAMRSLMLGLNAAYRIRENRNPAVVQLTALSLTLAIGVMIGVASLLFVLGTSFGERIAADVGLAQSWYRFSTVARTPILGLLLVCAVTLLHRFGPAVKAPLIAYVPGAVFTVAAIAVSLYALQIFFARFSTLDEIYGAFSSAIAFMLWVYVTSLVVLIGGAINLAIWSTRDVNDPGPLAIDAASAP
ncbi:MAG: YihY/virulence factor BrkB family protein [Thermomicrobiales bacterium]